MSYLYRDVTVPGREKCRGPVHTEEVTQPSKETHVALGVLGHRMRIYKERERDEANNGQVTLADM